MPVEHGDELPDGAVELAHHPAHGDSATDVPAAVTAPYVRADPDRLRQLATEQRRLRWNRSILPVVVGERGWVSK